ncbi:hypothetical protein LEP1GSC108_0002 [Leptospira weilii str. UI 13098]|uniref:Uncharacterized protein n=2 Tax=Leptospira weilii TaxID=28184 RepID=M6Q1X7_9LEPT|nr:hypothetical protein LEP1GSC108_0002 [Leptospira weilii str. UI 13098]
MWELTPLTIFEKIRYLYFIFVMSNQRKNVIYKELRAMPTTLS